MKSSLLFNIFNFKFKTNVWQAIGWFFIYFVINFALLAVFALIYLHIESLKGDIMENQTAVYQKGMALAAVVEIIFILLLTSLQIFCKRIYKNYKAVLIGILSIVSVFILPILALAFLAGLTMFSCQEKITSD